MTPHIRIERKVTIMRHTHRFASSVCGTNEEAPQSAGPDMWDETGERLFRAGEYVAAGEYMEVDARRSVVLPSPDFLPARLDGRVACYRLVTMVLGR